jgi:ribosomal protein L37AE/L43A
MVADPFYQVKHPHEIQGHPVRELYLAPEQEPLLITVCASCEQLRTILFLAEDRWLCTKCRAEGNTRPSLYPIA